MRNNYKTLYVKLRNLVSIHALIIDCNSRGVSFAAKKNIIVIYVSPAMCWRRMLFVLAHEVCHYFDYDIFDKNNIKFKERSNPTGEITAAREAGFLLLWLGCTTAMLKKYEVFYENERINEHKKVINAVAGS